MKLTSQRLNLTHGWKDVSSNIRGFINDMLKSGIPDSFTTQSICWEKKLIDGTNTDLALKEKVIVRT